MSSTSHRLAAGGITYYPKTNAVSSTVIKVENSKQQQSHGCALPSPSRNHGHKKNGSNDASSRDSQRNRERTEFGHKSSGYQQQHAVVLNLKPDSIRDADDRSRIRSPDPGFPHSRLQNDFATRRKQHKLYNATWRHRRKQRQQQQARAGKSRSNVSNKSRSETNAIKPSRSTSHKNQSKDNASKYYDRKPSSKSPSSSRANNADDRKRKRSTSESHSARKSRSSSSANGSDKYKDKQKKDENRHHRHKHSSRRSHKKTNRHERTPVEQEPKAKTMLIDADHLIVKEEIRSSRSVSPSKLIEADEVTEVPSDNKDVKPSACPKHDSAAAEECVDEDDGGTRELIPGMEMAEVDLVDVSDEEDQIAAAAAAAGASAISELNWDALMSIGQSQLKTQARSSIRQQFALNHFLRDVHLSTKHLTPDLCQQIERVCNQTSDDGTEPPSTDFRLLPGRCEHARQQRVLAAAERARQQLCNPNRILSASEDLKIRRALCHFGPEVCAPIRDTELSGPFSVRVALESAEHLKTHVLTTQQSAC